jgi:hypothetical protein
MRKMKRFGMAAMAAVLLSAGMAAAEAEKTAEAALRTETDHKGREWKLEDWKQGDVTFPAPEDPTEREAWEKELTRPYPRDLKEREEWYHKNWGEHWDGQKERARILTPGTWKQEIAGTLPEPYSSMVIPAGGKGGRNWGGGWPEAAVFAPGAGEVVDIYGSGRSFFMHIDAKTGTVTYIGDPEGKQGYSDGINEEISMAKGYGHKLTTDTIRGRVYWSQNLGGKQNALRYLEKLLPYREVVAGKDGEVYLLPSVLAYKDMHTKVKGPNGGTLKPELVGGIHKPSFTVRTVKSLPLLVTTPGAAIGRHPLLTPDGTGIYLSRKVGDHARLAKNHTLMDSMELFSLATGKGVKVPFSAPTVAVQYPFRLNSIGTHGGSCMGLDGVIYMAQTGGCGSHAIRLSSFDPAHDRMRVLANSHGPHWMKSSVHNGLWDGPADAWSLCGASTKYAAQCPRTGGFYFAGWDWAGLRRYHGGFVTSLIHEFGRSSFGKNAPVKAAGFTHNNSNPAVAPNGALYIAITGSPQRVLRVYRTDWPKEQPAYGYGEKFLPKTKIEELMLEHAKEYIAGMKENDA